MLPYQHKYVFYYFGNKFYARLLLMQFRSTSELLRTL
jgi:hypothetical protein